MTSTTLPSTTLPSTTLLATTVPATTVPGATVRSATRQRTAGLTVVVLHAHPDDEAIFTGVALRRLADRGVRTVLVTATCGGQGRPRIPLRRGESLRERRTAELERSCALLGVQRLVQLGYEDSGAHAGPYAPGALGAVPVPRVARRLARVVEEEGAGALVHYDRRGVYAHVDHVQVHRAGRAVVRRLGVPGYEATVDADHLRRVPGHVLRQAAGEDLPGVGVLPLRGRTGGQPRVLAVDATPADLLAKMAAMAAHASQIEPGDLDHTRFAAAYGREWFVRSGAGGAGPLDLLLGDAPGRAPQGGHDKLVARR